jgi:hypothetical protein
MDLRRGRSGLSLPVTHKTQASLSVMMIATLPLFRDFENFVLGAPSAAAF